MKKRKIYLLLTRFHDNGSKAIGMMTGYYYTHASIGLEEDINTFYSFVTKGFIIEKINRYVKPDRAPFPCQLYEFEVTDNVYFRIKEIIEYFVQYKSLVNYTKLGVVLSLLHIPYKRNHFSFFCTQFVAEVLNLSGAAHINRKTTRYFSKDLREIPGMKLYFQGNLSSMMQHFGIPMHLS